MASKLNGARVTTATAPSKRASSQSNSIVPSKAQTTAANTTVSSSQGSTASSRQHQHNHNSSRPSKDAEGNINVVVRCRGRSSQETSHDTPVVAQVKSLRGTTVTLANPALAPTSSLAPISSTPLTRTYDFGNRPQEGREPLGNVFGPDADQVMLYNDVARPILDQVLHGYNCTIFAYGQTGTGKTFTMEGDLSLTNGISRSAGIIPRTLYSLFAKLAEDKSEFSVRCSFVELYNEELRDLNALEFVPDAAPAASTVDSRSGMAAPPPSNSLRIYDDKVSGSGTVIQGLEETLITSAEEGLKVLKRGSERRQIAATKCNEHSSRSHSIFTITIHIKEASKTGGEDLLKVGKLNLVDLAGSENVGRSGAVQGRAREAGMINASLLALGRVINKLVEKQSHIPYRESKLTRLLQDSLGGRTKTTIIATISPVNFDETISTLDYALRAKTIQNRPEVNQRMSKNVLLSQYATEIERLKSDVLAAREKNGIFLSSASWTEMTAEQEARRVQLEEIKKQLEINDAQLETTRDQFEQALRLLGTRDDELRKCSAELDVRRDELRETVKVLDGTRVALDEERVLRDAFAKSRQGWKGTAAMAIGDVHGLRAKLARKTTVEQANLSTVSNASITFTGQTDELSRQLDEFQRQHEAYVAGVRTHLSEFDQQQQQHVSDGVTLIDERLGELARRHATALSAIDAIDQHGEQFRQLVDSARAELLDALAAKAAAAAEQQKLEANKILLDLERHARETATVVENLVAPMRVLQAQATRSLEQEMEVLRQVQEQDQRALLDENARLRSVIDELKATLEAERAVHEDEDAELVALLSTRFAARSKRHFAQLAQATDAVRDGVEDAVSYRERGNNRRREQMREMVTRSEALARTLERGAGDMDSGASEGQASLASSLDGVRAEVASYQDTVQRLSEAQIDVVRRAGADLEQGGITFRTDASTSRAQLVEAITSIETNCKTGFAECKTQINESQQSSSEHLQTLSSVLDQQTAASEAHTSTATQQTAKLRANIASYLTADIRTDVPTGRTPRKREYARDALLPVGVDLDLLASSSSASNRRVISVHGEQRSAIVMEKLMLARAQGTLEHVLDGVEGREDPEWDGQREYEPEEDEPRSGTLSSDSRSLSSRLGTVSTRSSSPMNDNEEGDNNEEENELAEDDGLILHYPDEEEFASPDPPAATSAAVLPLNASLPASVRSGSSASIKSSTQADLVVLKPTVDHGSTATVLGERVNNINNNSHSIPHGHQSVRSNTAATRGTTRSRAAR